MAVDKLNPQSLALFFSQHQRHINTLIVVLLALYLLAFAAELIWRIIPEPQSAAQNTVASTTRSNGNKNSNNAANISALQRLNLFGQVQQATQQPIAEAVSDAPETRLNLVLTGVVSSSTPENGAAIIENRGSQDTYGVGEKIDGTNATLRLVQEDRVIIRNGPRDETLMLEGINYEEANRQRENRIREEQATRRTASPTRQSETPQISEEAANATRQLRESPASFIDFISVAPYREDNALVGYRVSPGRNSELFKAVGLESGDVITQINGLDVTDPDQTMEAMGALRNAPAIELTVSRKGDVLTLFLELPEPSDS